MPAKKASVAAAAAAPAASTTAAAAARPRRRSSLSLNGSNNGSEGAPAPPASASAVVPARKSAAKPRTTVPSASLAGQQATAAAAAPAAAPTPSPPPAAVPAPSSGSATRTHGSVGGHSDPQATPSPPPAAVGSSGAARPPASAPKSVAAAKAPGAAASKTRTPAAPVAAAVPVLSPPAAAHTTSAPASSSSAPASASTAGAAVLRRPRGSLGGHADPNAPPAAAPSVAAAVPAIRPLKSGSLAASPPPPASHRSSLSSRSATPPPPQQQPVVAPVTTTASATRPRRPSTATQPDRSTARPAKVASASPPPPASAEVPPSPLPAPVESAATAAAPVARKRGSTSTTAAPSSKARLPSTKAAEAAPAGSTAAASVERSAVRKKAVVLRRGSEGESAESTRPPSAGASRRSSTRGSLSMPAAAAGNTAPPTRDSSVAPQAPPPPLSLQRGGTTSPPPPSAREMESLTSTALNTARDSVPELDPSALATTAGQAVAPLAAMPRRSHGPVVSEEWTRSIIKPGDEHLLYAPATAAFARTSSGTGAARASASGVVRGGSKGRSSPYDPQLRRAQQTVLQQRHLATPTPGRRSSTEAATTLAGTSGGSGARVGSAVKRSGTRLQKLRRETEERQRSLNATQSTPHNEEGSAARLHGSTLDHSVGGRTSASPTPSRMSDGSAATGLGGGGRLSAATSLSRRSAAPSEAPLEHIPGAASVGGVAFRGTPPGAHGPGPQRSSPSLALFARPSPRIFATPSPRGSTGAGGGVTGKITTFGVSTAPYYTGNEELTKLTRVREDMLRALMLSSASTPAAGSSNAESTTAAGAAGVRDSAATAATTPLSTSASSLPASTRTAEASSSPVSPSAARRPRQRIYGVDVRASANGEAYVSPQKAPAADVAKPRGRVSTSGADSILASSMRQKPTAVGGAAGTGATVSPSRSPAAGATGSGAAASTRPKLDTAAVGGAAGTSATTDARAPRRSAVTVALAALQPANTLGERARVELVRQQETATPAAAAPAAPPRSAPISFEEATRRLLLDPFFPLVSEENYQRLVLQNDEYNERKALVVRICASPPPRADTVGGESRRSGTAGPKAARALEMDLAEADDIAPEAASASPTPPTSFALSLTAGASLTSSSAGVVGPRRPSVQYGGPAAQAATPTHPRSPSPAAPLTSSPVVATLNSPVMGPTPPRDAKLLVNAVMPSEKTGPIKPLALSGVGYTRAVSAGELASSGVFQRTISSDNGAGTPRGRSPHGVYSRSPSASRSSSRHRGRHGSLLRGAQPNAASPTALTSRSVSSDSESTASDEAVDEAEVALRGGLARWGPFRSAAAAGKPRRNSNSVSSVGTTSTNSSTRRARKGGEGRAAAAVGATPDAAAAEGAVLAPAMLDELDAYVHAFLKRFRKADAATAAEIGEAPTTPLALQRAIRQSLRLSCGAAPTAPGGKGDDDEAAAELLDPLDDGSYHSQNVQYVLELLGSMLQLQNAFCDDAVTAGGRAAARVASHGGKQSRSKVPEADFLAVVMARPARDKSGQSDTDDEAPTASRAGPASRTTRRSRARPLLKLHDPELRAVELMFAHHNSLATTTDSGALEKKKEPASRSL